MARLGPTRGELAPQDQGDDELYGGLDLAGLTGGFGFGWLRFGLGSRVSSFSGLKTFAVVLATWVRLKSHEGLELWGVGRVLGSSPFGCGCSCVCCCLWAFLFEP